MTPESWIVLAILAIAVVLFMIDKVSVDYVALGVMVALILTGLQTPAEAFAGFASPAVVTVWGVFIISGGIFKSGLAEQLARILLRLGGSNPLTLLIVLMLTVGGMSAFMNNIGAVAILLPAVMTISRQTNVSPSKLLMPLAFAALMGGNMTLIGTPPNILASDILENYGNVAPFAFFDFFPTGLVTLVVGILYTVFIGRYLIPDRQSGQEIPDRYEIQYVTEVFVSPYAGIIGKTVAEINFEKKYNLNVLHIRRGNALEGPKTEYRVQIGDILLLAGQSKDIIRVRKTGLYPISEWPHPDTHLTEDEIAEDLQLTEMLIAPRSHLAGETLQNIGFRTRYGVSVLAIQHHGQALTEQLGDISLDYGDALLVQGSPKQVKRMEQDPDFLVLTNTPISEIRRTEKGPIALVGAIAILLLIISGWVDVSTAMVMGALFMVGTGVLRMEEAYEAIDWKTVFLIAGMLPLGVVMEETGTAKVLAEQIVGILGNYGPYIVLGGMFMLTSLLTSVISNAATTVLMVPIAIDTAVSLTAAPEAFVMATVIAASTSFLMPVGHQVNLIIYAPGGYKFSDYARVGLGLNILLLIVVTLTVPIFWPLFP